MLQVFIVVCALLVSIEGDTVGKSSDNREYSTNIDTDNIDDNESLDEEDGQLPRSEKSLLGTFPSSYNPRARQPIDRHKETNVDYGHEHQHHEHSHHAHLGHHDHQALH